MRSGIIIAATLIPLTSLAGATFRSYSSLRLFLDMPSEEFWQTGRWPNNKLEDILEARARFFASLGYYPTDYAKFTVSGKIDFNGYYGGDSRSDYTAELLETYAIFFIEDFDISFGNMVVSWGKTDSSPLDVLNPVDIREFIFTEEEFRKVPAPMLRTRYSGEVLAVDFVLKPFWYPPKFHEIRSDWAFLNYSALANNSKEELEPLLEGKYQASYKDFPVGDLLSLEAGISIDMTLEEADVQFVAFSGLDPFPMLFLYEGFIATSKNQMKQTGVSVEDALSDVSAAEIIQPVVETQGKEVFATLKPEKRCYLLGGGFSYELSGSMLKGDAALILNAGYMTDDLDITRSPSANLSLQLEKELISDLYAIFSLGELVIFSDKYLAVLDKLNTFPSLFLRYTFKDYELLSGAVFDLTPGDFSNIFTMMAKEGIVRSWSAFSGLTWSPKDELKITWGFGILEGPKLSPFGYFDENDAVFVSARYYF